MCIDHCTRGGGKMQGHIRSTNPRTTQYVGLLSKRACGTALRDRILHEYMG